jgi:Zn-dependent peptidase ImmA (M78 family)/transcriptional regulator with XRE-family HTH domain
MSRVAAILKGSTLSLDDIATKARLDRARVRELLAGGEANLSELRAISRALRVPLRSVAMGATSDLSLLFRSSAGSRPDRGVEAAAEFVDAALTILPRRELPPDWLSTFGWTGETYQEAERLADQFRSLFYSGRPSDPLIDLPKVIVQCGQAIVATLETSRFEGASVIADGYSFIFVSPRFEGRMLFTLAHEIGHLIAHHGENRAVVFDLATRIGGSERHSSRPESFVNAFASVLLMPASGVGRALREIRQYLETDSESIGDVELLYLARFFGVSFEVAAQRCENLDLVPAGGARSLSEYLKKTHGGPEKRAASLRLPPRPRIDIPHVSENLLAAVVDKVERGEISAGWAADRFGCTIGEIYAFHSQPEAFSGLHN